MSAMKGDFTASHVGKYRSKQTKNYDIIFYSSDCQTVVQVLTGVPKQVAIATVMFSFQHFHWDLSVDVILVVNGLVIRLYVWQALGSALFIYITGALKTKLCIFKVSFPMGSEHLNVLGGTKKKKKSFGHVASYDWGTR
jgi:hypothetical protein